jgi:hypothetical protein
MSALAKLRPAFPGQWPLAMALGTFHAAGLLLVFVLLEYAAGNLNSHAASVTQIGFRDRQESLLANLNTYLGFGLFLALWACNVIFIFFALEQIHAELGDVDMRDAPYWGQSAHWGGIAGVSFLNLLLVALLLVSLLIALPISLIVNGIAILNDADEVVIAIPVLLIFDFIGSIVAYIVGGVFGLIFGLIDGLLIKVARALLGMPPTVWPAPPDEAAPPAAQADPTA